MFCISIVSLSQTSVSWKKANFVKTDNMSERIFRDEEGNVYVLYYETTPFLVIKNVSFNKFTPDLQFESKIPVEVEKKDYLSVFVVGDLVCMAEQKMPSPKSKSNYAMFFNCKGELVKKIEVDAQYNIESIKLSKDEKDIILYALNKVPNPNKKLDNEYFVKVWAYDKKFEKLAEESFKFEDIFTNAFAVSSLNFDITANNKIISMCSGSDKKLKKALVSLAVFNKTGEKPKVYSYSFDHYYSGYEYNFGKNNELFISGALSPASGFASKANSALFFINQSLESDKSADPVIYETSKQFFVNYPECKKILSSHSIDPFGIFVMSDGILYGSMKVIQVTSYSTSSTGSTSSKTRYYSKSFVFIKFSFSGEIKWLKVINKELYTTESAVEMAYCTYKQDGDILRVVYNDNPANIINKGTKMVRASMKKSVPALAEISVDGTIKTTPLDKLGKNGYFNHPRKTLIKDDAIYLLDFKIKPFGYPDYFIGKVTLAE